MKWGLGRPGTGFTTTRQWTEIQKISCLLSSCTNSHFSANYLPFCGGGTISSITAVVLLYSWQSLGMHEGKLTQWVCSGYVPQDRPPDGFQEWVSMPELLCVACKHLSSCIWQEKKKKALHLVFCNAPRKNHISGFWAAAQYFPQLEVLSCSCCPSRWRGSPNKSLVQQRHVWLLLQPLQATDTCLTFCWQQTCLWTA